MCCAFVDRNGNVLRPGRIVEAIDSAQQVRKAPWAGFARSEILHWWKKQGAEQVAIEATRFAERTDDTRELVWDDVPEGHIIRALLDKRTGKELLKVVTRPATETELARFRHPRMPLLEKAG